MHRQPSLTNLTWLLLIVELALDKTLPVFWKRCCSGFTGVQFCNPPWLFPVWLPPGDGRCVIPPRPPRTHVWYLLCRVTERLLWASSLLGDGQLRCCGSVFFVSKKSFPVVVCSTKSSVVGLAYNACFSLFFLLLANIGTKRPMNKWAHTFSILKQDSYFL